MMQFLVVSFFFFFFFFDIMHVLSRISGFYEERKFRDVVCEIQKISMLSSIFILFTVFFMF